MRPRGSERLSYLTERITPTGHLDTTYLLVGIVVGVVAGPFSAAEVDYQKVCPKIIAEGQHNGI